MQRAIDAHAVPEWCSSCDVRCAPLQNIFEPQPPLYILLYTNLYFVHPSVCFSPPQHLPPSKTFAPVVLACTVAPNPSLLPGFPGHQSNTTALYSSVKQRPLLLPLQVPALWHRSPVVPAPSTEPTTPLGTYYRPISNSYHDQLVASDALTQFSLLLSYNFFTVTFKSLVFPFFSVAFSSSSGSSTWIVQGC